ncbi:hypothetical protein KO500_16110 [Cellulophaga baltica]|uniref:hypothetical protein n=1 Tax=Cellulophaga TaxID=104264 RepID=UPI001C06941B|nr:MULTISPECIES: hypothetical protein [Cellulophaga]MBU2997967.1 hypothetical protein [Cellulophaga baltica]MDO6769368.1 hypothetical protein [Cellulophaga sp. 1_MG-2023]
MKATTKEQLQVLKDEATQRGNKITAYRKTLVSNYDSYIKANGLDELRDLNIFILDCSYRNRHLIKLIDNVFKTENKIMTELDLDTMVTENLKCLNDFQSLKLAMSTIRTSITNADTASISVKPKSQNRISNSI